MKKILFSMLALVAIATTASADEYDIWVGGVRVTSANASNITGGDIKGGTVKYDATENELILRNVTITRSGKSKQGIRNQMADLTITFFGTNTITTDNSCALRCDANTYLWMMKDSKTTFTEKQQEAFYVTGGKSLFIIGSGSHWSELYVNSTNEYAIEGEKGTERVVFTAAPIVTLNGKKGSLVKLGEVVFTESSTKSTSVTLKATNDTKNPQVQNVAKWTENGYNHIAAPVYKANHPKFSTSSKTILAPDGLSGNLTSYDIVINEDVVQLNSTHFPDANFLAEVKKLYPKNTNGFPNRGFYSKAMAKAVTKISVSLKNISNLKGIEHFTGISELDCYNNQLTSLDVSKNTALTSLHCINNQLTSLDVSQNTALTRLSCGANDLTKLDVSKNTALTRLDCGSNDLTKLDVSKNTALTQLDCNYNQLTSLDVSENTALTQLHCGGNQLTSLDVSKNTALTQLYCNYNQLTSLDVSKNTALTQLHCGGNQLTSLDVLKNTALTDLRCFENQIKGAAMQALVESLPMVSGGKGVFFVVDKNYYNRTEHNVITTSQVAIAKSKNWSVYDNNKGNSVEYAGSSGIEINPTNFPDANFLNFVSGATIDKDKDGYLSNEEIAKVTSISVSEKNIANLKGIEHFTALTRLNCWENQLTELDVSKNTKLEQLGCSNNQLTSLDVSGCTALKELYCYANQLTSLDVSGCTALKELYCYNNKIKGDKMLALVNSLPKVLSGDFVVIDTKNSNEGNVITKSQVAIAKGKNWKVYDRNGRSYSYPEYEGSDDTPTGLTAVESGQLTVDSWYTIDGKKLNGEPTKKGVYIVNGKKVVK